MFRTKLLFTIIICLVTFSYIIPQENEDSTETSHSWWKKHHKFKFDLFSNEFRGHPSISVNYGLSKMSLKDFNESFAKPNMLEVKLGYTRQKENSEEENIIDYKYRYLFLSNFSTDLSNSASNGTDLKTDMWKFGFGRSSGYGYKLGAAAIIPYHAYSFEWSRLRMKDTPLSRVDQSMTDLFNDSFRFGTSTEGGIKIRIIHSIMLDAGYERSIIFPRHIFWKWAGSVVIEAIGQSAIDKFVDEVMDSSPYAAPVVNFVLKNALSYGIYELRHDKMNWPFATAAPLAYDQFKFGLTFVF